MAEYQNFFTQVQVSASPEMGMVEGVDVGARTKGASFSTLMGWIGHRGRCQHRGWPDLV